MNYVSINIKRMLKRVFYIHKSFHSKKKSECWQVKPKYKTHCIENIYCYLLQINKKKTQKKRFIFQMMFFTMLFMYSAFVLTSIATEFYVKDIAKLFEYYVYFWGAGDLIEELICCFVSLEKKTNIWCVYCYTKMLQKI